MIIKEGMINVASISVQNRFFFFFTSNKYRRKRLPTFTFKLEAQNIDALSFIYPAAMFKLIWLI